MRCAIWSGGVMLFRSAFQSETQMVPNDMLLFTGFTVVAFKDKLINPFVQA
jgi:hypothetical protein